jgi:hypothetical protein
MSFKTLFIDTNIFLHYKSFDDIDWLKILNVDRVEICLTDIVIQELDKHKYSPSSKLRDKASKVIKKLHKLAEAGLKTNLKTNIDLYFEVSNKSPDFPEMGLDPNSQDDRLLASILLFRIENPEKSPILVAADLGLRLKAMHHQIENICLPDEFKLVAELDQTEKRIKELERENLELQRRIPKLELCFTDRADRLTYKVKSFLSKNSDVNTVVQNRIEQLKQKYPKMLEEQSNREFSNSSAMTIGDMYGSDMSEILPDEISNYNKKLDEFYESFKQYLEEHISWLDVHCRVFPLKISIFNSGTCPAEDVDVFMHFPDGFILSKSTSSDLPDKPKEPQPPPQPVPRTRKDRLSFAMPSFVPTFVPTLPQISSLINSQNRTPPNISSPDIRRSNSYDVRLHVQKLKQNTLEGFDPMIIVFDSFDQISSFQIDYTLVAANVPTAATGKLHVIFSSEG